MGIIIAFLYNFPQLRKDKTKVDKFVTACNAIKHQYVCDPSALIHLDTMYPNSVGYEPELNIIASEEKYLLSKKKTLNFSLKIIMVSFIFGAIPLVWIFFLNRICDISNAVRGNKK